MLKSAGLLVLFLSFSLGGVIAVNREKSKIECTAGLILLIRTLKTRAAFFREPPQTVFDCFSHEELARVNFLPILRKQGLEEAVMQCKNAFCITQFSLAALEVFALGLGKTPMEEHLSSCDYVLDLLSEECEKAKGEFPKKQKLYLTLAIALGLVAVILLL